jgi:hypothetical protein
MASPSATTSGLRTGGLGGGELSNQTRGDDAVVLVLDNPKSHRLPKVQLVRGIGMIEENRVHLHWVRSPGLSIEVGLPI